MTQVEIRKRAYEKRKKLGKCVNCSDKALETSVMCKKHLELNRKVSLELRELTKYPLCTRCNYVKAMKYPIETWCTYCRKEWSVEKVIHFSKLKKQRSIRYDHKHKRK